MVTECHFENIPHSCEWLGETVYTATCYHCAVILHRILHSKQLLISGILPYITRARTKLAHARLYGFADSLACAYWNYKVEFLLIQ